VESAEQKETYRICAHPAIRKTLRGYILKAIQPTGSPRLAWDPADLRGAGRSQATFAGNFPPDRLVIRPRRVVSRFIRSNWWRFAPGKAAALSTVPR
jgi:hypothetical protein